MYSKDIKYNNGYIKTITYRTRNYLFFTMNLSERSRVDKELFSGERSSYENTSNLETMSITKNTFHTTVVNVGLLIGFIIVLEAVLFFKYKGKMTPVEKRKKDYEKQQYILSKITKLQQVKREERQELITRLVHDKIVFL